jgi:hypothetical protein
VADIFISYKRSRRAVVQKLAAALQAHGWEVWFDARLTEGEQFRKEIESELALARCAIVLWCYQSVSADFVLDEAGWAKAQGALIQARWMDVRAPLGFGQQQQVDMIGWCQGLPPLAPLIAAVERLIGAPGHSTRGSMGRPFHDQGTAEESSPLADSEELAALTSELTTLRHQKSTWDHFVFRAYFDQRMRLSEAAGRPQSLR